MRNSSVYSEKGEDLGDQQVMLKQVAGSQGGWRKGARVEAMKKQQNGYFAATVLSDVHTGNRVTVRFDDFQGDEEVDLAQTRALAERRSYPDPKFRLTPISVEEFEHQVFYRALRRGKAGLKVIDFIKSHGEELKTPCSDGDTRAIINKYLPADATVGPEERAAAQELFAEILEMCPYQDFISYQLKGGYDEVGTCLQLFYCARNAAINNRLKRESTIKELHSEKGCFTCSNSSFTTWDGVREMIQGHYILESWRQAPDSLDAYNDVVAMNQNLGLIAALILTIAIPPGLAQNNITVYSDRSYIGYLFCISVVSMTEGLAVLLTTRNLIALNALEPENIKPYLAVAQNVLLMPIRLNFVAVLAMFGALNLWAVAHNGIWLWLGFFLLIVVPTIYAFFATTGAGIVHLYAVQPWRSRKVPKK